jgi:hypothetical protein
MSVSTRELLTISSPNDSQGSVIFQNIPSINIPCNDILIVSNGCGIVDIVQLQGSSSRIISSLQLPVTSAQPYNNPSGHIILCSRASMPTFNFNETPKVLHFLTYYTVEEQQNEPSQKCSTKIVFVVNLIRITLPRDTESEDSPSLEIISTLVGDAVPLFTSLSVQNEILLLSESRFKSIHSINEIHSTAMDVNIPTTEAVYKWHQSHSEITVEISLEGVTHKSQINCQFSPQGLTLCIAKNGAFSSAAASTTIFDDNLFDIIKVDECIWTLENNILTLHLQKGHEGTRWSHLLERDDDVLGNIYNFISFFLNNNKYAETLDIQALAEVTDSLRKYTNEVTHTEELHRGIQKAATEPTEEEDFEGSKVWLMKFNMDGALLKTDTADGLEWLCSGFNPSASSHDAQPSFNICLKYDVDGVIISVSKDLELSHKSTLPAFAFIQTSKRDKKYLGFSRDCEYAFIVESRRRLYVYSRTGSTKQHSPQYLIDLPPPNESSVIGFQQLGNGVCIILRESSIAYINFKKKGNE